MNQLDDGFVALARHYFLSCRARLAKFMALCDDNPVQPDELLAAMKDIDGTSEPLTTDNLEKRVKLIIKFSSEQLRVCPEDSDDYETLCTMRKESIESLLLLRKRRRRELYSRLYGCIENQRVGISTTACAICPFVNSKKKSRTSSW